MNDFFRSQPAALGDIGYWNDKFYIKDISLPEYLAEQIASRVRMDFFEDKALSESVVIKSSKGEYLSGGGKHYFQIAVQAEPQSLSQLRTDEMVNMVFKKTLEVAALVLHGYHFEEYDYIEMVDETSARTLKVTKDDTEKFRRNKLSFDNVLSQAGS